jgi:tungstate transport system ATP-binding protein
MSNVLLDAQGISVRRRHCLTLKPMDLSVDQGERVAVYGPNGAGKSTLLQALAGLLPLATGTIQMAGMVLGQALTAPSYHRRIAAVFQEPLLLKGSVAFNVGLGLALRGIARIERDERTHAMLKQLKIDHLADRHVGELSGGEAQRTSLARALVLDPEVLFLDEPFAALDQPTRRRLVPEITELLHQRQVATLFVTHDFAEASTLCDRCLILDAGEILQSGPPALLQREPKTSRVAEIVGSTYWR